jgi:cell division protease FtsH
MGGYVAEQMIFGDVTTGPSNDLERATKIARNIVTQYGMSDLGVRTYGKHEDLIFLGREVAEDKDYSEKTAEEIDKVVSEFLKNAKERTEQILEDKKDVLDKIAQTLIEKETIEKDEFDAIIVGKEYIVPIKKKIENIKEVKNKEKTAINVSVDDQK